MNQENIVYSTDPNFSLTSDIVESESILNDKQNLRVHLDRRKGGKIVTIIRGYLGPISELKILANSLKKKLSVGGSVKNDEILLQGNLREKVLKFLINNNFNAKPSGG
mgnify:FL=1